MRIPFTKAQGTGNDFIILWEKECPGVIRTPEFISAICARRTGVGADALLILSRTPDFDFKMDYYNSDGSWETMCANGSRCAALFMVDRGLAGNSMRFLTGDGSHRVEFRDSRHIRLQMTPPSYAAEQLSVGGYCGNHVDSGAAHFVIEAPGFTREKVVSAAPAIRHADCFAPRGVNVNFYQLEEDSTLRVLTYEKGVESFMLSCGSGSVAAAYDAARKLRLSSPISIRVPGGKLQVEFDENWQEVWLTGPAVLLFKSTIDTEDLLQ
ncbi:MAG: diaminopimelate epimerase [FCB group bacterium]|nr:diaminopimelate epimerase [FCB group bacterium]